MAKTELVPIRLTIHYMIDKKTAFYRWFFVVIIDKIMILGPILSLTIIDRN